MKTPSFWNTNNIISKLLSPISFVYGYITQYRINHTVPYKTKAKVICVGNITAGGVGKTPVSISIAKQYIEEGKKVFFVTRGYKGKIKTTTLIDLHIHTPSQTGDEARLLANIAPTIISPKRDEGAKLASSLGAEIIIMDDGFQNPSLYKDESILVFDGTVGIGNGKIIPSGPLRETLETGLKRANYVIIMGEDKTNLKSKINLPCYQGKLVATDFNLKNKNVLAFAGIGHPSKFYNTLKELGYNVALSHDFEDHHNYTDNEIKKLKHEAKSKNLSLVTTQKDYVKLTTEQQKDINVLYVNATWC